MEPGYTCWTTLIFGTLKDSSLQINSWAPNNYFSYRNVFQNAITLYQKSFYKAFVKKLKISCCLNHTILFKFYKHVVQIFLRNL